MVRSKVTCEFTEFQSESNHAEPNHSTNRNEVVSAHGNSRPNKRKKYRYSKSIVDLSDSLNSVQIAEEDSSPSKIPKQSQHLSAIAKKQTSQIPTENINLTSKLAKVATSINTENNEGNERCQTERVVSISDEFPDAQNDEVKSNAFECLVSNR